MFLYLVDLLDENRWTTVYSDEGFYCIAEKIGKNRKIT